MQNYKIKLYIKIFVRIYEFLILKINFYEVLKNIIYSLFCQNIQEIS
jgi:predicted transglutaminase-like protease